MSDDAPPHNLLPPSTTSLREEPAERGVPEPPEQPLLLQTLHLGHNNWSKVVHPFDTDVSITLSKENCGFSHLPDSFSLGSGGRNVCLLSLIGRCDVWGCSYSHARDELDWTDDQVKILVHAHLQLIDGYNGRMARNPPSFHIFPFPVPQPVSLMHSTASQPYPTPSSSIAIDPASLESEALGEPYLAQQSSWRLDELQIPADDSPQYAPAVSPELASGDNLEGPEKAEDIPQETCEMETPHAVSLNPLAIPFVPSGWKVAPTDEPSIITPILDSEITPSPIESEIFQSPAADEPIQDHNDNDETPAWSEETPKVSKIASKRDIDAWSAVPESGLSWNDVHDPWANPNGGGEWDEGPGEDAFKTPPRTPISPTPAQQPRKPSKSKEKPATTSWRDRKSSEPQPASGSQKGISAGKKSAKFEKFSSPQRDRRQSTPGIGPSKKNDKCRSLVTVHSENIAFSEPWREGPPHQTPEMEDEELANSYSIKPQLGSIIPTKEITTEIAKAHLQVAREKASYYEPSPVTEEPSEIDPGINWVNGGSSRLIGKADTPREFSERSRPAGLTWGKSSGWPKLSE